MRHPSRRSAFLLLAFTTLTLGSCATHQRLATQAVSFNLTVERAQNEMLLLNVIRAKDRLPMYLSGISGLTGNVQTTLTTGLGSSYTDARATARAAGGTTSATTAGAATSTTLGTSLGTTVTDTITRALTPSAGATFSKNPTFTLAVLDTQEFMRGFLQPLGKDTLNYYWTQGWPRELLLYLLVQRVEIEAADGTVTIKRNYPDSADPYVAEMGCFAEWVEKEFLPRDPQIEAVQVPVSIGPELPTTEVANLRKLVELAREGLQLKPTDSMHYQLQKPRTDLRFRLTPRTEEHAADAADAADAAAPAAEEEEEEEEESPCDRIPLKERELVRSPSTETMGYSERVASRTEEMAVTSTPAPPGERPVPEEWKTVTFLLRSPEALLYYLGELARLENRDDHPKTPHVCIQGQYQPLFVAVPQGSCDDTLVDADTGRGAYSIPPTSVASASDGCIDGSLKLEEQRQCESGRSMQALRLLNQILSLQKSAKDNPATGLVRVID